MVNARLVTHAHHALAWQILGYFVGWRRATWLHPFKDVGVAEDVYGTIVRFLLPTHSDMYSSQSPPPTTRAPLEALAARCKRLFDALTVVAHIGMPAPTRHELRVIIPRPPPWKTWVKRKLREGLENSRGQ